MGNPTAYHPTELAYVLSYVGASALIGWGAGPFTPSSGHSDAFFEEGLERLKRTHRLLPGKQAGRYRFSDETARLAGTLANPEIVFLTLRRDGEGAHLLTHSLSGTQIISLSLGKDGNFQVVELASLAGAAGAAAAFVGATAEPAPAAGRISVNKEIFGQVKRLANTGKSGFAVSALVPAGVDESAARSLVAACATPTASGVVSVLYCAGNAVQDAEAYAVLTNPNGESWVIFEPTAGQERIELERTSIGALSARILVAVSVRMMAPA